MVAYLLWRPDPNMKYMFYIFAGLWGLGDAVIQTQINGNVTTELQIRQTNWIKPFFLFLQSNIICVHIMFLCRYKKYNTYIL